MDYVYVIYFDGKLYKSCSRKIAYLKESSAKQVITSGAKNIAYQLIKDDNKDWYDLTWDERDKYINKAKSRFSIHKFIDEILIKTYKDENTNNIQPRKTISIKSERG